AGFDIAPASIEHPAFDAVRVDLSDGDAAERAAKRASGASALVHAAGVLRVGPLGAQSAPDGEKMWRSQYAATKAALVALARSWAAEVVAAGVTINVVSPAA